MFNDGYNFLHLFLKLSSWELSNSWECVIAYNGILRSPMPNISIIEKFTNQECVDYLVRKYTFLLIN